MEAFIILTRESLSNFGSRHMKAVVHGSSSQDTPNTNEQTVRMIYTCNVCKDKMALHFLLRIPLYKIDKFTEETRGK